MHPRTALLTATAICVTLLAACSSDDDTSSTKPTVATSAPADSSSATSGAAGASATVCATADAGERKTVTIDVADDSDGFGRFGLKTPSPLPAGSIRLLVDAADDNPEPVDVTVTSGATTVFNFVQVAPGAQCGADVELAAGDYTVTYGAKTKTFTVVAA